MDFVELRKSDGIATPTLSSGKVNALNGTVIDKLRARLKNLQTDPEVKAVILTGSDNSFSFGFDIPEFLVFTKEQFAESNLTDLDS